MNFWQIKFKFHLSFNHSLSVWIKNRIPSINKTYKNRVVTKAFFPEIFSSVVVKARNTIQLWWTRKLFDNTVIRFFLTTLFIWGVQKNFFIQKKPKLCKICLKIIRQLSWYVSWDRTSFGFSQWRDRILRIFTNTELSLVSNRWS